MAQFHAVTTPTTGAGPDQELRIDDLARRAGTTVRNVRAYQDRGLLTPPRRAGRVALYDADHLARLRLIGSLLERGFSLANIGELLDGWRHGLGLGDLLGLGAQGAAPFSDEEGDEGTAQEIAARYGLPADDPEAAAEALAIGLVEVVGDRVRVPSPRLLRAGLELHRAGVPLDALFDELRALRADVEGVAERMVRLIATHVVEPHLVDGLPDAAKAEELAEAMARIRPLATTVVDAELARALQARSAAALGARLTELLAAHADTTDGGEAAAD